LPKRDVYIVEGPVPPRPEDLEIVLALNNRIYETISLTAWIADNPPALLTAISACPKAYLPAFRGRKGQCVDAGSIAQPPKGMALAHEGQRCGSSRARFLLRPRHEHVTDAAHGADNVGVRRIRLYLAAQAGDAQVDGAVERLHLAMRSHFQ
jgi:hypothetical protein